MNPRVLVAIISLLTFSLGIVVTSYAVTSGPGGKAKLSLGKFSFEIQINETDLPKLLASKSTDSTIKELVKSTYDLYEINSDLITEISKLNYQEPFSEDLRALRDKFIGPFNAPDLKVEITFSDSLDVNKAQVCPDSLFYQQRINIALADFSNMDSIDNADVALIFGCPTPKGTPQPITISRKLGQKLLKNTTLPDSISAVAKVLPSYVIVK